ncbi:hypothetical protein [Nonomuraea sp. NPDC049480]|uniref:hypothetical protein n=1 Tax=Nonomuraea sp. NPDC049480 TaxID=3364353 RepID=UPI002E5AC5FC|nr:hypothetical protein [Nonomuraea sp.]
MSTPTPDFRRHLKSISPQSIVDTQRATYEINVAGLAARLNHDQRLRAEQVYEGLYAHLSRTWWRLVARHTQQGLGIARAIAKFSSWIGCYLTDDLAEARAVIVRGNASDEEQALAHLECALELIKRAAAREFLDHAAKIPAEQLKNQTNEMGESK